MIRSRKTHPVTDQEMAVVMSLPYFAIQSERQLLSEDTGRARFAIVDRTAFFSMHPVNVRGNDKKAAGHEVCCQDSCAYGTGRESCPYRAAGAPSLNVIRTRYAANHSPATAGVGAI